VAPEKERKKRLVRIWLILLVLGVLYYCFFRVTGIGIPCLFRLITGFKCPGCGISTMLIRITELDLAGAFAANRFLFVTSPFLLFELVYSGVLAWKGEQYPTWNNVVLTGYTVCLVLFGIIRNLPNVGW